MKCLNDEAFNYTEEGLGHFLICITFRFLSSTWGMFDSWNRVAIEESFFARLLSACLRQEAFIYVRRALSAITPPRCCCDTVKSYL